MESVKNSRRKAFYLLMSVLVALAIWLYADLTSGPNGTARLCFREITDIPVEYTDVATLTDRGLMLVDEGSDLTVNLKLRGTRWMVSALDKSEICGQSGGCDHAGGAEYQLPDDLYRQAL